MQNLKKINALVSLQTSSQRITQHPAQLKIILQLLANIPWLQIHAAGVFLFDPGGEALMLVEQENFPAELNLQYKKVKIRDGFLGFSRRSGEMRYAFDAGPQKMDCSEIPDYEKYVLPIESSEAVRGVLVIYVEKGAVYARKEVITLQDFTQKLECSLAVHEQIDDRQQLSDLILTHSQHGIMITDRNLTISWVNKAFEDTTGYRMQEVIGKTPKILNSGRHDKQFYADMWQQIHAQGLWSGEVWNKRKDGAIYPEWLNIVALKDADGRILCYAGMFIDLSELKASEEKIIKMAYFDGLTGLASREYLSMHLENSIKSTDRQQTRLALLFIDLDEFKNVNDTLGHDAGDFLLKVVSSRFKSSLRESDFIARLGGDEFCIVLDNVSDDDCVGRVASACLQAVSAPVELDGYVLTPRASIGIAYYPEDASTQAGLFKAADSAMYAAKHSGKHRFMFYKEKMTDRVEKRLALENDLQQAIQNNEFELYYQPKVDIRSGTIEGFEALIRWNHPRMGFISPLNFISLAEYIGVIDQIGVWVMETACQQLALWRQAGLGDLTMAVNISPKHFEQGDFSEQVEAILAQTDTPAHLLEIEITESLARNINSHIDACNKLTQLGAKIAIDDFGTGYSSLSVLKKLDIHTLKIDKTFIDDLMLDTKTATMLGGILAMASGLEFDTVVEGVEHKEQLAILYGLGCRLVQGFYFSKPVRASEIPQLVASGFEGMLI